MDGSRASHGWLLERNSIKPQSKDWANDMFKPFGSLVKNECSEYGLA